MRVAILHYHLRPGGVTRVIENAVAALGPHDVEVVVLSGEDYEGMALPNVRTVPGLGYRDHADDDGPGPDALAANLLAAARDGLGGEEPDVWHVHNHSLGKNAVFIPAFAQLLAEGRRALLQVHDFAEDGRPGNYRVLAAGAGAGDDAVEGRLAYPLGPGVHYAVLNARDAGFLRTAGAPEAQLHLLPNAVHVPAEPRQDGGEAPAALPGVDALYLYPTRGIRRKNIGEAALIAACAPEGAAVATTLAPKNPVWQPVHDRWAAFAEERGLRLHLGAAEGEGDLFPALVAQSEALLTTSIAEGFGLAFLEPWGFGKRLVGRDLPDITRDFRDEGLDLADLYTRLPVPVDAFDFPALKERLASGLRDYYAAYGREAGDDDARAALDAWVRDGQIDFGCLDEPLQEQVIARALGDAALRAAIADRVFKSEEALSIGHNREVVRDRYSLAAYGERLAGIYRDLAAAPVAPPDAALDARRLLDCFLDPTRFRLLRS